MPFSEGKERCQMINKTLKTKLLKEYKSNLDNPKTRNHYLSYANHFLDNAEGLDRASIDKYIEEFQKHNKPGTVNFAFRVIRRVFKVNESELAKDEITWPYRPGEAPTIGERDEYRPQLSPHIIEMMIAAATSNKLFTDEQCFLALSTIFALRRGELAHMRPADINLGSNAIYVVTLKMGRERYHLIPPEIKPYLEAHDFSQSYAEATMSQIFKRILRKSGAGNIKDVGWHAIRRAVVTGLINNGVNPMAARIFMRWKSASGDMAMPSRYYGNAVIDLDQVAPMLEEAKGDEKIFENHPFLPFWRNNA
jgi:integrase